MSTIGLWPGALRLASSKPIVSRSLPSAASRLLPLRSYHSHQHPAPPPPFTPTESTILSAALLHVPSHGFSTNALSMGARDAGFLDISVNLFPRGVFDLVNYHLVTCRLALGQTVKFEDRESEGTPVRVSTKIRTLVMERLKANEPIIHRWQEALAIMSLAGNIPASVSELAKLSDEIWFLAGDDSADTSWYTKRATLSGIYASTEIFMTQDTSKDFAETWKFLDRRMNDARLFGRATSNIVSYVDFTAHAFKNVLRSKNVPFF